MSANNFLTADRPRCLCLFSRPPSTGDFLLSMTPGTEKRLRDEELTPSRLPTLSGEEPNAVKHAKQKGEYSMFGSGAAARSVKGGTETAPPGRKASTLKADRQPNKKQTDNPSSLSVCEREFNAPVGLYGDPTKFLPAALA